MDRLVGLSFRLHISLVSGPASVSLQTAFFLLFVKGLQLGAGRNGCWAVLPPSAEQRGGSAGLAATFVLQETRFKATTSNSGTLKRLTRWRKLTKKPQDFRCGVDVLD